MPSAEIITIGSEILLGELVDTNSAHIAKSLRAAGIDLYRLSTIGDNSARISQAILEGLSRADIVITTGGLGPTVDDPTREAVANAFGLILEYHENLWQSIADRLRRFGRVPGENQKKQAYIPHGAIPLPNPVGTAPAFIVEQANKCVISLPGVPSEMDHLLHEEVLPYLLKKFNIREVIKVRLIKTYLIGEGALDERIADLERLANPTVGLSAHFGMCDIRVTAKAASFEEADAMIDQLEKEIRLRAGDWIYGVDQQTIQDAIVHQMALLGQKITFFMPSIPKLDKVTSRLPQIATSLQEQSSPPADFSSEPNATSQSMKVTVRLKDKWEVREKIFAGNEKYFREWTTNQAYCELLRYVIELANDSK